MTIAKEALAKTVWHPNPGQPIEDEWGDRVADSVIQHVATIAERDALTVAPNSLADGALVMVMYGPPVVFMHLGGSWHIVGTPPGTIIDYHGGPDGSTPAVPSGFLLCNGQGVPPASYLNAVLGLTVTPQLADGRFTRGATTPIGGSGGSPNALPIYHDHAWSGSVSGSNVGVGAHNHGFDANAPLWYNGPVGGFGGWTPGNGGARAAEINTWTGTGNGSHNHNWSGSVSGTRCAHGHSGTDANLPPYLNVLKCIKL